MFAIDLDRSRAFEWSPALPGWRILNRMAVSRQPVLEAVRHQEREVGKAEGLVQSKPEALVVMLAARGLVIDAAAVRGSSASRIMHGSRAASRAV